jgi:phage minor structural protein
LGLEQVFDVKQEVQLWLTKPNLQTIHKFNDVSNRKLTVKYNDLHELSFSIPYKVDINHRLVDNPAIALVRERYVVKVVLGQLEEYFIINKLTKSDNITTSEVMDLTIHCFHLPYELYYKRYRSYTATSYNCLQVTTDCLDSTPWKVGNIDPVFDTKYRQFDLSSGNRLDFLNQISTSFNAIKTFDTKNRLVNFVQESNISKFKGWNIKPGQYLDGISDDIDLDQMVTRLYCYGNNDLTFNDVSANGQSYVEDFSHFLYPFEMDDNGNVTQHSNYMSDALCKAILDHGELVEQNKSTLSSYLSQISKLQQDAININNIINDDNTQLTIVDADIKIYIQNGRDTTSLNQRRTDLVNNLTIQKRFLKDKNDQIDSIKSKMDDLKNILVLENYLKNNSLGYLVDELRYYIIEDEFTDDNIIDSTDLYNEGLTELAKRNSPPVNISISLIDFLACVEESYNWSRLSIGDLVNIIHPILGIKVQAKISQIDYDFEGESIQIGITNATRILSDEQKFINSLYNNNRTSTDYNNRKIDWQKTSYNFNSRNDRISETPIDPTFNNDVTDISHVKNDNGSVTLTVNWNYPTDMTVNENNIDGFNVYLYASNKAESVALGSMGNNESIINVNADARKCTIPSVPANLYYYIGVQAYRDVDNDISSSGIILSNIVKSRLASNYPYQPETTVDVTGKLNGVTFSVSDTEPTNPQINDEWTDTTTHTKKVYTSTGWQVINTQSSSTLNGYEANATITPNSIPIRDNNGDIPGNITGSAMYLNGKSDTSFAQLDSTGKVNTTVLPTLYTFGSYNGDGTGYRKITLPFTPRIVRIYTTNTSDISVYINSTSGGYKLNTSTSSVVLVGMSDGTPYAQFGKLTTNGFVVAQDSNLYSNKSNVLYYYEAFL